MDRPMTARPHQAPALGAMLTFADAAEPGLEIT